MPTNPYSCSCGRNYSQCTCNKQTTCGTCINQVQDYCVFYTGNTTPCLGITTGKTLNQIIGILDAKICTLSPSGSTNPSGGCCPTVTGTNNQIIVTTTGSSSSYNYQVGLSPTITGDISTIQSQINNISTFLDTTITTLSTATPSWIHVYNTGLNAWNVDYIQNPSGLSGIIYSDYTDSTTLNTSWTTVKTYSIVANQLNTDGDKIVVETEFLCATHGDPFPYVRLQFNGVTIVVPFPFNTTLNIYDFEVWIVRVSNTTVKIKLIAKGGVDNTIEYVNPGSASVISYVITMAGLNLTTTNYSFNCDILSANAGDVICKYLELEYKHKI